MGKYIKYLSLSLLLLLSQVLGNGKQEFQFKGNYFLYCPDLEYIIGIGNINLSAGSTSISGERIHFDVNSVTGVIYGNVIIKRGNEKSRCQALFFSGFPLDINCISYEKTILGYKNREKIPTFVKRRPDRLKENALYFEFSEFTINQEKKIKARYIIPYFMGVPGVPMKRFTIKRGKIPEKTIFYFKNINYTDSFGFSLTTLLRLRETIISGDHDLKLYERDLFGLGGVKRGFLFSGKGFLGPRTKEIIGYETMTNSKDRSFVLNLFHKKEFKNFNISLAQNFSGRKGVSTFYNFTSSLTLKHLKIIVPEFTFTHNFKNSFTYKISSPLHIIKKVNVDVSMERKILKDDLTSNFLDFSTGINYSNAIFSLSSNYNYSKNYLETSIRQNMNINGTLKPVYFLNKSIALNLSSFFMFSSFPNENGTTSRTTPGFNLALRAFGVTLPFGFRIIPGFRLNHIWNDRDDNFTEFNYLLGLAKEFGNLRFSIDYSLASLYKARNFWIEGYNTQNIIVNFDLQDNKQYLFNLKFFYNNRLALENISLTGKADLPFNLAISSYLLYYTVNKKLQTLEIFLEKTIKNKIKLQGGYSLILKRFYLKLFIL